MNKYFIQYNSPYPNASDMTMCCCMAMPFRCCCIGWNYRILYKSKKLLRYDFGGVFFIFTYFRL